ncbi:MAG TPA: NPCBM/NEW2 domain-containing protein [Gaiellaceae bacterium]|jgi:uncharacterized cupredoxin-like copper-binding protein|nr:NPCBM/NEW2 domain-containing protein [Gaiellaceae bacterium]
MTARSLALPASLLALLALVPAAGASHRATPAAPVTATATAPWIVLGSSVGIKGTVSPHPAGTRVTLQKAGSGSWVRVATAGVSAGGGYSFTVKPGASGTATFRVTTTGGSSASVPVPVLRWSYLGDVYAHPTVGDLNTETMDVNGASDEHPVALDAGCYNGYYGDAWVDYPLAKKYETLTATMGLGGYVETGSTGSYEVIGAGKTLASGKLVPGASKKISVSLAGLASVRLKINVPDPNDAGGCGLSYTEVVFGNAQVLGP